MRREPTFVPFGRGDGNVNRNRDRRAQERARGDQRFEPGQPVDVLDPYTQAWLPGRFVRQAGDFVRVELDGKPKLVVKERLRPRETA